MATYQVETDKGVFEVETDEPIKSSDPTIIPTLAAGMIGAQGSSLKEEGVLPAIGGALNELTGGAFQNPRSFGVAGTIGANVAAGEDLIGSLTGKEDRDRGIYTPRTLGGNLVSAGAGMAAGAGMSALPEAVSRFLTRGTSSAIKSTGSLVEQLTKEIDDAKVALSSDQSRVSRVEGTANTFLKQAHEAADEEANAFKTSLQQEAMNVDQSVREKALAATKSLREKAVEYSSDLGRRFNDEYTGALKGKKISEDTAYEILHDTVKDAGLLNEELYNPTNWSPAEKRVYAIFKKYANLAKEYQDLAQSGKARQTLQLDLSNFDSEIRDAVGAFRGKQWGSGENILTNLRKNAMARLSEYGDAKVISAKYAPEFKLRNAIFDRVKPFDRTGEASRAIDSFSQSLYQAASGKMNNRLNEFDTISKIRKAIKMDEFDDLFREGELLQKHNSSMASIDELNKASKLKQQQDVDSFIARQKSELEQKSLLENARLEGKTKELERSQSILDSLIQKEKRIGDLAWKVAGGAATLVGAGGVLGIGKTVSKAVNDGTN